MGDPFRDIAVWRDLARLMPGWEPTLQGLKRLDEGPSEVLVALRAIARGWDRNDARWDVLQGVLEYYNRQHAHELAEEIRHHDFDANVVGVRCGCSEGLTDDAADLIDPEVSS